MPLVIVDDEDFALREHVLRPCPNGLLSAQQRIYDQEINKISSNGRMCIRYSGK